MNKFELDKIILCTNRAIIDIGQDLAPDLIFKCEAEV